MPATIGHDNHLNKMGLPVVYKQFAEGAAKESGKGLVSILTRLVLIG